MLVENKDFLVTGASGFLGRHIVNYLKSDGHMVHSLGRTGTLDIVCDIGGQIPVFEKRYFEVVVHAAGKAHSHPRSDTEKEDFFKVNLQGTINLCKALETTRRLPESFIFISSVSVYGRETGELITEDHPLLGNTAYAESKIKAEAFLTDWCNKNSVRLSILRLPLVVGKNAPGNLMKMINAIKSHRFFYIASHNPRKSMVSAADIAEIIPLVIPKSGTYNLTDGYHPTMRELGQKIANELKVSSPLTLPFWPFRIIAKIGDTMGNMIPFNTLTLNKITHSLTFDDTKARKDLSWNPVSVLNLPVI